MHRVKSGIVLAAVAVLGMDLPARSEQARPVVLIHLPGIAGELPVDRLMVRGLIDGGVSSEVEIIDWTGPRRGVLALSSIEANKLEAAALAKKIESLYRSEPRPRIVLTSHSGGTGIAVWALEMLPPDVQIDSLAMIASALSAGYDLSPALRHVRGRVHSFHSPYDNVLLSTGTRMLGTIDRVNTDAAGYAGFKRPAHVNEADYAKLVQHPYDAAWMQYNNAGGHIGPMMPPFAEKVIAPMLMAN
ncbi:MAG TPA: hypothetical protein VGB55_15430 [Tepidisphaeraceae bacterium]